MRFPTSSRRWVKSMSCCTALVLQMLAPLHGALAEPYALGSTVGDMRQPANRNGGTSCPQRTRFDVSTPGSINRQWSTSLGASPATILTLDQSAAGRPNEIEAVVRESLAAWTAVPGTLLQPTSLGTLQRTSAAAACSSSDGVNSICFNQNDAAFAIGVLAFTRVVSADVSGAQLSPGTLPSKFVGEILDADVLLRPGDANTRFATPAALPANLNAYDLESILIHELGHSFGFSHSGVWRAMMFPFAAAPGHFTGIRPGISSADAPLSDDDRTGLRVLYPDAGDTVHVGSISGRILPANSIELPASPPGITGIFPAQVVAVSAATGAVVSATIAGWTCAGTGPPQFDGSYVLERLPVDASAGYQIYVEPLDGPVTPVDMLTGSTALCRNAASDPGWPSEFACVVPSLSVAPFSVRMRPGG